MTPLSWEDVLKRDDLVGGDIEIQGRIITYRGPLAEIRMLYPGTLHFLLRWCAKTNPKKESWQYCYIKNFVVNIIKNKPRDIGDGCFSFTVFNIGTATLFPKDCASLEPHNVQGIPREFVIL